MVNGGGDGGHRDDIPPAVRGQNGQRGKDVEVELDPAATEVDPQRAGEHLCRSDEQGVAAVAGAGPGQNGGGDGDDAAEDAGGQEVLVGLPLRAGPGGG